MRQLGIPTWFCSLSAAETKWSDLLKILGKLVKNVEYTDDDIKNLTWTEKCELIQGDPVTCTRYFDHRVQVFIWKCTGLLLPCRIPTKRIAPYSYACLD